MIRFDRRLAIWSTGNQHRVGNRFMEFQPWVIVSVRKFGVLFSTMVELKDNLKMFN